MVDTICESPLVTQVNNSRVVGGHPITEVNYSRVVCGHLVTEVLQHCSGELLKLSLVLSQALQLLWQAGGQLGARLTTCGECNDIVTIVLPG